MPKKYKQLAKEARIRILTMIHEASTSHIASNFSVVDLAVVIYENLKKDDEVVWSKGWAAASIYYFLAKQGKIPMEDLEKFGKEIDGKIPYLGLAETSVHGVHVSAGSMGHGLPVAVGMALAKKRAGERGKIYCIMSDGELNEGTTWEAAMIAFQHRLNNLVVLIDANKWQAMGRTRDVLNVDPITAFSGFGWATLRKDGHDHEAIEDALLGGKHEKGLPLVIVCDTIKGFGVSFFEDHLLYHYKHVDEKDYQKALKELENELSE